MFGKHIPHVAPKDALAAVIAGVLVFLASLPFSIPIGMGGYAALLSAGAVFLLALVYRKINDSMRAGEDRYRQVEELFSLFHTLNFRAPLPALRGWALSPDLANIVLGIIAREKPQRVLDLGSGASTVLIGYALEKNGHGTVLAVDHDAKYAERSKQLLKQHGLEKIANVQVAPLSDVQIPAGKWRWYDPGFIRDIGEIDLVVVDGPPDRSHFLARYPALPLLYKHLSPKAVLVIDDAFSPAEKEMVQRWLKEFPDFREERVLSEKGTCVLRRV